MTPEQLREWADAIDGEKPWAPKAADVIDQLRAHAAALEELARVKDELLGVKEYREKNPLGGPAKVFDAMADQIRAGDDFNRVIADYGWCPADRAERAEAALAECRAKLEVDPRTKYDGIDCRDETIRLLEAALAEAGRKCERLKFHADAMAELLWYGPSDFAAEKKALDAYRAEFKEDKP